MDFGEKDYNLLVKLKEIVTTSEWESLMNKRLDVIYKNIVVTDGSGDAEVKVAEIDALKIYEELRLDLQKKYKM